MARFYDTINDSDLKRVEALLRRGGIEYSLQILGKETALKEIRVAEEDVAAAEQIMCGKPGCE